jgi:titin
VFFLLSIAVIFIGCTSAITAPVKQPIGKASQYIKAPDVNGGGNPVRPPSTPQNLVAIPMDSNGTPFAWLSWEESHGTQPISYYVYRSMQADFNSYNLIGITDSNEFNDYNVLMGNTYYYRVRAKNAGGFSGWSNIAEATFEEQGIPPSPPRDLNGMQLSDQNTTYNFLWWQKPLQGTEPFTYNIYRDTNGFINPIKIGSTVDLNFSDFNISVGITYYYAVTAENEFGESDYSNIVIIP